MSSERAELLVKDASGASVGRLEIGRLPGRNDRLESHDDQIVVDEEGTYVFSIAGLDDPAPIEIAPGEELFSFDDSSRRRGRFLPRQHVGRIRISLRGASARGEVLISVLPRKLNAETEYRAMLDDIAKVATEAVLQGFAPAALALQHRTDRRPELVYQQFAFLHARLVGAGERDLAMVLNRPHRAWVDYQEHRAPGRPIPGGSRNLRSLGRPGPRLPGPPGLSVASVPTRITVSRSEETLDTEPNRFVLFALQRWRELALKVQDLLSAQARRVGPIARGLDAAEEVLTILDRTLSAPMFRDVGRLTSLPTSNQVLQKRAGYRELLRTFILAETGAGLALDWDLDDVFAATQRNVATLYEYWAFAQLAKCVGRVCGVDLTGEVLQRSTDGLSLGFRQGRSSGLRWTTAARGRPIAVELFFNRTFLATSRPDPSWTRAMRPDCSLRLRPEGLAGDTGADDLAVWLHFDAKYRVEFAEEQFAPPDEEDAEFAAESEATERLSRSKREDLLKMHAYRDAIRRSAGAYVLYPGDNSRPLFSEHHEILPGLGAFALRPGQTETLGVGALEAFLTQVLDHVADRATQHERSRYWRTVIHREAPPARPEDRRLPGLSVPPSDAPVLCCYLRSPAHRRWVDENGLYNVRAGDRRGAVGPDADVLRAVDVILYGRGLRPTLWARFGAWFVQLADEMVALGYPNPRGKVYLCCPIERRVDEPEWLGQVPLGAGRFSGPGPGAPFATTWQELLDSSA